MVLRNSPTTFVPPPASQFSCRVTVVERGPNLFPAYLHSKAALVPLLANGRQNTASPNLSDFGEAYIGKFECGVLDLFRHLTAILHAPSYRKQNASALTQDWPRIPLPATKEILLDSAALGKKIAALLDTETEAEAAHEPALQKIAAFISRQRHSSMKRSTSQLTPGGDMQAKAASPCPAKEK